MSNGTITVGKGGQIVLDYFKNELNPAVADLQSFAEEVASYKVGFFESLTRKKLDGIERRYAAYMSSFMRIYKKWHLPDEMFRDVQIADKNSLIAEYMQIKPSLTEHINEGFRVLAFIDKLVGGARSTADNQVAVILALIAITISIVTAVFQL
ncbi:MAG: hypothetical protein M0T82_01910 [Desulfobacteraceae bacterium]|nr:hypothetical protein [Desulfobacteraceae bacterium]